MRTAKPYISVSQSGRTRLVNKRTMSALRGKQKPKGLDKGARDVVDCGVEAVKVENKMTAKKESRMEKYLTKAQAITEMAARLCSADDDSRFCPHCLSECNEYKGNKGIEIMCPNEWCAYEEIEVF